MRRGESGMTREQLISVWSISVFLLLAVLQLLFTGYSFQLGDSATVYISRATIDGVSVTARLSFFYKICGSAILLLPIFLYLVRWYLARYSEAIAPLTYLSVAGILLIVSDLMLYESSKSINLVSILLVFSFLVYSVRVFQRVRKVWPALLMLAFICTSNLVFLFNSSAVVVDQVEVIFGLMGVALLLGYIVLVSLFSVSSRSLFQFLLPLALSPLLVFLTIECHFLLQSSLPEFPYKKVFSGLLLLFFALTFFLRKRFKSNTAALIKRYFAPAALLSFLLQILYQPIISQPNEMFELGNPANAQMRIFSFGEIPFVDFMTSHMFSEQYYGILYHIFYGFDGSLDFLTYSFLYYILSFILAFYFLLRLFGQWIPAILLAFALPYFNLIFSTHLFFTVVAFMACVHAAKFPTTRNFLWIVFTLIALIVWRLDTGVAALFSTVLFLPLLFFVKRENPPFRAVLSALGISLAVAALAVVAAVLLRSADTIYANFQAALHYVAASQAHGYSALASAYNHQFFIIHFLLPLLAILAVFLGIKKLRREHSDKAGFALKSSIFFFLVFLTNFPRGLVRHGFLESRDHFYTSTFYLASALLAVAFCKETKPYIRYSIFCFTAISVVFSVRYFPLPVATSPIERYFASPALKDFDSELKTAEGRVVGSKTFAAETYEDLAAFLDDNLTEEQTFLDFSNSPMLYYYCGREVPSYFAQSLQNTIDDFTQINHLSRLDTSQVPIVVYSHVPPNWFDATDGVPNAMRYYLISEYIYQNYRPLRTINGYSIWGLKSKYIMDQLPSDNPLFAPYYDYGHAPAALSAHFRENDTSLREVFSTAVEAEFVDLSTLPSGESSLFISLRTTEGSKEGYVEVSLVHENRGVGTMKFFSKNGQHDYLMPLTNFLSWHEYSPSQLKIDCSDGVAVEGLIVFKDLRGAH